MFIPEKLRKKLISVIVWQGSCSSLDPHSPGMSRALVHAKRKNSSRGVMSTNIKMKLRDNCKINLIRLIIPPLFVCLKNKKKRKNLLGDQKVMFLFLSFFRVPLSKASPPPLKIPAKVIDLCPYDRG